MLDEAGADLVLHDCGELTAAMVAALASRVRPAVLSLGSSRRLWEDAALVPPDVVLFGNLPTKHFYSDETLPLDCRPLHDAGPGRADARNRPPLHPRLRVRRPPRARGRGDDPPQGRGDAHRGGLTVEPGVLAVLDLGLAGLAAVAAVPSTRSRAAAR